jgi:UDP-N-acetylglucosamine transferase subunit ALG13
MILVTVGTQIPFDRLVKYIDQWASESQYKQAIVAQVGVSEFQSNHISVLQSVEPEQFEKYITECDFIVSHAGMGSILTALRVKKPIILFPRKAALGEHRNDHQLATARSFSNVEGVYVAYDKEQLFEYLNCSEKLKSGVLVDSEEYQKLIINIKKLIS